MRLPRWLRSLTRSRADDQDRDTASGVSAAVMNDLKGLRWELERTVRGLESMVDDGKDDP